MENTKKLIQKKNTIRYNKLVDLLDYTVYYQVGIPKVYYIYGFNEDLPSFTKASSKTRNIQKISKIPILFYTPLRFKNHLINIQKDGNFIEDIKTLDNHLDRIHDNTIKKYEEIIDDLKYLKCYKKYNCSIEISKIYLDKFMDLRDNTHFPISNDSYKLKNAINKHINRLKGMLYRNE